MSGRVALREALLVYGGVLIACVGLAALGAVPFVREHQQIAVGAIFLVVALEMAHRDPGGPARLGLGLGGLLTPSSHERGFVAFVTDLMRSILRAAPLAIRESAVALALAAVVFPPFVLGYFLWHRPASAFELEWPPHVGAFLAGQLVAVALPEEAFFRGYLQTRLTDASSMRVRLLGVELAPTALFAQAALFALIHFAFEPSPARLAVFFPALVFGLLRERRGGIGAAIVFHAACNVLADLLWRGFS
jgi:uncharacterized protein